MRSLTSIITPAHNAQNHISEAIESIINQTYTNWELIIVDDGSTDDTARISKQYQEKDQRIKYIYQDNAKQGKARNTGLIAAEGEWIAFLDSDDLWLPERLEIMIAELEVENADVLFSDAYIFENEFDLKNISPNQPKFNVITDSYEGENGLSKFLLYNRIPMLTTLIKKEALFNVNLFSDRGICEDYEMWLKLLVNGYKMRSINKPLAAYRIHANSTTSSDRDATDHCIDVIYSLRENLTSDKYYNLFSRSLISWCLKKLNSISNNQDLRLFLLKLIDYRILKNRPFTIPAFFRINKKIAKNTLLRCQHQFQ